jgi:hypothetical protein
MEPNQFDQLIRGLSSGASRRRLLGGLAATLVGGTALATGGDAKKRVKAQKANKTTLCHKPATADQSQITVANSAVDAHLAHGDTVGTCQFKLCAAGESACATTAEDLARRQCGTDTTSGVTCYCATTAENTGGCFVGYQDNCTRSEGGPCVTSDDCDQNEQCVIAPCCFPETATDSLLVKPVGVCIPYCGQGEAA